MERKNQNKNGKMVKRNGGKNKLNLNKLQNGAYFRTSLFHM